jgi:hypothetical protein
LIKEASRKYSLGRLKDSEKIRLDLVETGCDDGKLAFSQACNFNIFAMLPIGKAMKYQVL